VTQTYWVAALRGGCTGSIGRGPSQYTAISRTRRGAEQGRPTHMLVTCQGALPKVLPWGGGAGSRPNSCTLRDVLRMHATRGR
jgi:hypothetical protein